LKFDQQNGVRNGHENVTVSNCALYCAAAPDENRTLSGIHIVTTNGPDIIGVCISNISMQNIRSPIFVRIRQPGRTGEPDPTRQPGHIRDIMIQNVYASGQTMTNSLTGLGGHDIENLTLSHVHIKTTERGPVEWALRSIPEVPSDYPECRMFGRLPAYGFFCRHIDGLKLHNIEVEPEGSSAAPEMRPALVCDDVKNLDLNGFSCVAPAGDQPTIRLRGARRAFVSNCCAPAGTKTFLRVEGPASEKITVMGNDLSDAAATVDTAADVKPFTVYESGNRTAKV
jgi:hypothetical protein